MKRKTSTESAEMLMRNFVCLSRLSPEGNNPDRYLWTDAFAVCNFLGLYNETGNEEFKDLALQLVAQVHDVLGRHRQDDSRMGWISGLDEQEGKLHPTTGGLRIGKKLNERSAREPLNERLEWDRDGQYYHYLTKWMHALNRVTEITGDFTYNRWAVELARTSHARFVYTLPSGQKSMYWKMSIDLSYPLVRSTGFHDPLDGLITYSDLQATATRDPEPPITDLRTEIDDMIALCRGRNWATDDPLGIGGLLSDAFRVAQLIERGHFLQTSLFAVLLDASLLSMGAFYGTDILTSPAEYRLAFRELGLSIGLHAIERLAKLIQNSNSSFGREPKLNEQMEALQQHEPLAETIEGFWLQSEHQKAESWTEHKNINTVMLATSLCPDGFLKGLTGLSF